MISTLFSAFRKKVSQKQPDVVLTRLLQVDEGTFGTIIYGTNHWRTLEPPWRDNNRNISCIPDGDYEVIPVSSQKYGETFMIKDVPERSGILIHSGNYAGDEAKGYKTHSRGCILLGAKTGMMDNQRCILSSKLAVGDFLRKVPEKGFTLRIITGE